jgi:hypothetical protein
MCLREAVTVYMFKTRCGIGECTFTGVSNNLCNLICMCVLLCVCVLLCCCVAVIAEYKSMVRTTGSACYGDNASDDR